MRIERVDIVVTELSGRIQRTMSSGPYDSGPSGSTMGKPVLVRIHAEGVVGYGQVRPTAPGHFVPDTTFSVVSAIKEIYAPYLIGKDIFDLDRIAADFDLILPFNSNARAAIDFALHDAIGKALALPVHKVIGGASQTRLPLEWSVSLAPTVEKIVADATRAVEEFGISVVCIKAGDRRGWRQDVIHFEAVREAVGPDVVLGVDPNTGWTFSETIAAMRAMAPYGLGYVEQPVLRTDIAGLARIRRLAEGVPVMADESLFTLQDAHNLATAEAVDVLCIKLYKTGGIRPAKKIAAVAEAANMRLNIGGLAVQSRLEAAASAHFLATLPPHTVMPGAEFIFGLGVQGDDPITEENGFVIVDGHVDVPTGPGLGIVVDEDAVAARTILSHEIVSA